MDERIMSYNENKDDSEWATMNAIYRTPKLFIAVIPCGIPSLSIQGQNHNKVSFPLP